MLKFLVRLFGVFFLVSLSACGGEREVVLRPSLTVEPLDDGKVVHYDREGDGQTDTSTIWTYANQVVVRKGWDTNQDGKVDRVEHRTYDRNGRCVRKSLDRNADGVIDAVTVLRYDPEGRLNFQGFDANNDGILDWIRKLD